VVSAASAILQTWTDTTNAVGGALFGETASPVSGPQGVTIINNARGGIVGGFVGLFGDDNTMTLGSGLIVSRKNLGSDPSQNITLAHEYGHIAQAQMLGAGYIPTYLALQAPALFDYLLLSVVFHEPVDFHDWNLMEIHAQSTIPGAPLFPSYELRHR